MNTDLINVWSNIKREISFETTLQLFRINNISNASHFRRFESFFYTLPDQYFWRTSDNDNAPL